MQRRRLAVYTMFFIAGITAGFFMFDRSRLLEAAGFAASVLICIMIYDENDKTISPCINARAVLALFFICGFFLFSLRSASYDRIASRALESSSISGKVISAEVKDEDLVMIIRRKCRGPSKVRLTVRGYGVSKEPDMAYITDLTGASIEAVGEYTEIMPADDPGCFDYRLYMRSRGVCVSFKAYSFKISDPGSSLPVRARRHLYRSREDFISRFDDTTAGFIRGVIFGDKSEIDEDTVREFNENSTGHILAVSGLHVGFLYGLLRVLTGRKRNKAVTAEVIAVLIMYGEMTMWSPATLRAVIVMIISLMALHFGRHFDLLSSLSFAALLILLKEPYQLFNSGFQLSFLAMCGIAFFTKPVSTVTGEALGVMISVQLGTLPLIAYSFRMINPLAVFINIPLILLSSVLVPLCILMLMCETVSGMVPHIAERSIELISYSLVKLNHMMNFGGCFSIKAAGVGGAAVIAVYLLLLGASSEWLRVSLLRGKTREVVKTAILLFIPVIMLGSCLFDRLSDDEIVFVAVGQGDCTHIRAGDRDILIDGGGSDIYNVGERILMPYLLREGAYKLDMALLTHLHADHYKGITELAEEYPVGVLGIPADYRESPVSADTEKTIYIRPDTRIDIADDIYVEAIWPVTISDEPVIADDSNEHNTVYMIHYKGIKVMVTGDLLEDDELQMVEYYEGTDTLKCDVLKVAHHGSKSSSSEAFLNAASPSVAVIQVGRNNFYGHPHTQTLERLEKRRIRVCRTDTNGAVGLDIRHGRIYVDLFHPEGHS